MLEIGCGGGAYSAWVARQVPQGSVVGVDICPLTIEAARRAHPTEMSPNLHFQVGDVTTLDLKESKFDMVVSNACLHYLSHPGLAFAPISRHLNPGGRMCIVCLGKGSLVAVYKVLERLQKSDRWSPYFQGFRRTGSLEDPRSCDTWLEQAGLVKKQARLVNELVKFPNAYEFQTWFNWNFGPYFSQVGEVLRDEFSEDFVDQYCRRYKPGEAIRAFRVWLELDAIKPV